MLNWEQEIKNGLDAGFAQTVQTLITNVAQKHNIIMMPYFGMRSLQDEAKFWRQSRSSAVVQAEINRLEVEDCTYLANIIKNVGACNGPYVTNCIPGLSWHNWGQAVDCYWQVDGAPNWDSDGEGYQLYAQEAVTLGLTAGYNFESFKDAPHVQLNAKEIPDLYTIKEVNDLMQQKYGG